MSSGFVESQRVFMKAQTLSIGELAKRSGLATSNIRFYEARGLIRDVKRQANGYRSYPLQAVRILELIKCAQQAGFTLEELSLLLPGDEFNASRHAELIASLELKVQQIEDMQIKLEHNKTKLLAVIERVKARPEGMTCETQADQVLDYLREDTQL
ncbi:MerR family transcriptional regulator [Pseudomonas sp. NA-150]|uniref:MerR family transcriptional regulator n=1 Tax=Pseudomonas sp. NA-150 TaxID=3367525 RepID=UPI0037C861C9